MSRNSAQTLKIIFNLIKDKKNFAFWLFVRFISACFPILTIYLFSQVVSALEQKADLKTIISSVLFVFISRLIDNVTRLISTYNLDYEIAKIQLDIQALMISGLNSKSNGHRHQSIQAIRNFSTGVGNTLSIFKQPGVDSLVSFVTIPIILLFIDFRIFILHLAYMTVYYFTDVFTTERYSVIKNDHNSKVEKYFGRIQDSNRFQKPQQQLLSVFRKLCNWGIKEWSMLQNSAIFFYSLILLVLVISVHSGDKTISDLVLVIGYINQTQTFLNSISNIKDSMADTKVALQRLLENNKDMVIDFGDLTS